MFGRKKDTVDVDKKKKEILKILDDIEAKLKRLQKLPIIEQDVKGEAVIKLLRK